MQEKLVPSARRRVSTYRFVPHQNLVEQEWHYPLPGGNVDRFMLKVHADYPKRPTSWR
jgi:MoxR-like ATPase